MAKYILHGGLTAIDNESNRQFFAEMAKSIPQGGTWLGIYFARKSEEEVQKTFERDIAHFKERVPSRADIQFTLATESNWPEEVKKADAIYLAGGNTAKLQKTLNKIRAPEALFKLDKTYAGSSAGMYVLGRDSLDTVDDSGEVVWVNSLNILPYRMVAHYGAPQYQATQANLTPHHCSLLMVPETQFIVIEQ